MPQSLNPRTSSFTPTTARGPRVGLFGALMLHGAIAAAALFTWQHHLEFTDESPPMVPVDLITIADKTNIVSTVQPQPKIVPEEAPATPPPVAPTPAPAPPKAEAAPEQAPSEPVIAKPAPLPKPLQKPQPPAEQKKPKSDDFSALLNKLTSPAAAPRSARTAERTVRGVGAMNAMTMELSDALKNMIAQCWSPPAGAPHPEQLIPVFRLFLNPDGSVAQPPQLTADSASAAVGNPFMRAAAEAARRAIYTCAPYRLPADRYNVWRDITVDFDPRKMVQ
jgi:outer membrane biosynthesis protein TonB